MRGESIEDQIIVADCVVECVAENIHEIPIQSSALTRVISFNDSNLCETITNVIFLLLAILLLGCHGYVISFCIDPYKTLFFFGFGIDEELTKMIEKALKNQWKYRLKQKNGNAWFTYHKMQSNIKRKFRKSGTKNKNLQTRIEFHFHEK